MYAYESRKVSVVFGKFPMDMETTEAAAFKIIVSMKQSNQASLLIYTYFYCSNKLLQLVPVAELNIVWVDL